ncbi:MAG: hypothetical protein K6G28_01355 [Acholeplasmatales bacterium]|nr:hypothetical protein [Acholeplasmatales bacterium]
MNINDDILKLCVSLSDNPKECFCQLRNYYNWTIDEFLEKSKLSHKVYDSMICGKRISRNFCYKMCLGFDLPLTVMKKVFDIFGYHLNENNGKDLEILLKYEKNLAEKHTF